MFSYLEKTKPYIAIVFIQCLYAFMSVVAKLAFNAGLSPHVLVAYRMGISTFLIAPFAYFIERNTRPAMTYKLLIKISILSALEPVLEHNLFYTGMKLTTATFSAGLCNALPAITFIMACISNHEKVKIKTRHSQAKILGTMVTIGGAMIMTFWKGKAIEFPWTIAKSLAQSHAVKQDQHIGIGAVLIIASCFCWSSYIIFQAHIMVSYPAGLSLTTLMSFMGTLEATAAALICERNNLSAFNIYPDVRLLAWTYGGLVSAIALYATGWISKKRGPVFVSAFGPLCMILVAILSSFALKDDMYPGMLIGAGLIVFGLFSVLWGKSKDEGAQPRPNADSSEVPSAA